MTQTTTIKAGDSAKTITLQEGQSMTIVGGAGALGVAYLLDAALGGMNPVKSWAIGTGALASAIGPYPNTQKVHITCTVGSIEATTQDAALTSTGGSVAAVLTGSGIVGEKVTATLPAGVVGTLQFTKTLKASPFTKSNIANAVANAVNSLQYTMLQADLPYDIGCDASNTVSPSNKISAVAASSGDTAPTVTSAPVILGTPTVDVATAATAGVYTGSPTPTVTRQWLVAGVVVATAASYTPVTADAAKVLTVRETVTNGAGTVVSNSSGVTIAAAGLTPYIGPISQRNRLPDYFSDKTGAAGAEQMTWVFRDSTSFVPAGQEIEMKYTNVLGPSEVMHATNTASGEIECSIEYPQGTFTRFKCEGADVGVLGDKLSTIAFKGTLAVDLPKGARFWVGTYAKWTGYYAVFAQDGICRFAEDLPIYRETQTRGVTTTNTCMTGVRGTNLDGWAYYPISICSLTTEETFGIVGDSQERGSANPIKNGASDGLVGTAERALKGKGTINTAVSGDSYAGALVSGNFNVRATFLQGCSHIVDGYGDNDGPLTWTLLSGTYGPQMKAKFPNAKYGHLTLDPKSTSTDYYMTVANQTVDSNLAVRNAINVGLRTKAAPAVFDFYVDIASTIETAPGSGLSIVSPNVKTYQYSGTLAQGATGITGAPAGTFSKALHDWHYMVIPGAGTGGADHVVMMAYVSDTAINFRQDLQTFPAGKPTIVAVDNPLIKINAKEYMRDAVPHRGVNGELLCNNLGITV